MTDTAEFLIDGLRAIVKWHGGDATGCNPQLLLDRITALLAAATAHAEAAQKERDEWRTKALDVEQHPVVVALLRERNEAQALVAVIRGALENVLKSARPHPVEHPTMTAAWKVARAALALTPASAGADRLTAEEKEAVNGK